jgi:hydantoinase/carbamoylase family amidase
MEVRQDAFMAACEISLKLEQIAIGTSTNAVATVGEVHVLPNALNVIPGKVILGIDIRDVEAELIDNMVDDFWVTSSSIAQKRNVICAMHQIAKQIPLSASNRLMAAIRESSAMLQLPCREVVSGAFHDALNMGRLTEMAMIFIPSKDGVSHTPAEFTKFDQIVSGTKVLVETLVKVAKINSTK